jgi:hypothetical protein
MTPPETLEQLVAHSEFFNGQDHNADGEPDWGYCLTPQVCHLKGFITTPLTHVLAAGQLLDGVCSTNDARYYSGVHVSWRMQWFTHGAKHLFRHNQHDSTG